MTIDDIRKLSAVERLAAERSTDDPWASSPARLKLCDAIDALLAVVDALPRCGGFCNDDDGDIIKDALERREPRDPLVQGRQSVTILGPRVRRMAPRTGGVGGGYQAARTSRLGPAMG